MKSKIILGSVAVVALASGVMFCGDEEPLTNDPSNVDRVVDDIDNTQREAPEGDGPLVTLQLGAAYTTTPVFWAVRIGKEWSQPPEYAGVVKFRLDTDDDAYAVAWACEGPGEDGKRAVHTTLVEATASELPALNARCASVEGTTQPVEVTGAIRNVDGQSPTLLFGRNSQVVKNEKSARDVLFSVTTPAGKQAFVAQVGDGEKAKFAVARNVDVQEGVNVEIDAATGSTLQAKTWKIESDTSTEARFGEASVWMDGRTRVDNAGIQIDDVGVVTHATADAADYVDLRADLHGATKDARAGVRFIARANRDKALPMPALTWVGPSYARIEHESVSVSWSRHNWAVLGRLGDDLALFMPVAYAATIEQVGPSFRFDLIVTPRRATGKTPYFNVPRLSDIDGWHSRFWFTEGAKLSVRAGNLTAYAGGQIPDAGAAIAAYLDENFSPAELGVNDLFAVVLAGAVTVQMTDEQSLEKALEDRCIDFYGCEPNEKPGPPVPGSAIEMAKSVSSCPDLEAWDDCQTIESLPEGPSGFESDLRREIARWYTQADIPNAVAVEAALEAAKADNAKPVAVPEGSDLKVYSLADPTRPDSKATWYGAYLDGRLISLQPLAWDAKPKE